MIGDIEQLVDDMLNDVRPDFSDISKYDTNGDGKLTAEDCPFEPGSTKAQLWYSNILKPYIQQQAMGIQGRFGDDTQVVGVYKGKALVPGEQGQQGDLSYVIDRLVLTRGMSPQGAERVAHLIKNPIYMVDIPK